MIMLDDAEIIRLAASADLLAELKKAFTNAERLPTRLHCDLPGGDDAKLLVMPAWLSRHAIGVKVATSMPANRVMGRPTIDGLYVLLDGASGIPRCVLSARALTAVRTAAVSALAADYLARPESATLLVIGTGALAPFLARAHAAVRPYEKIWVWGRDTAKAMDMAAGLADLPADVRATADLEALLGRVDVVSAATAAAEPIIEGGKIHPGTHVDLVGSFAPAMREADVELFARGRLVIDTPLALEESGDLIAPIKAGIVDPSHVPTLADLLRSEAPLRSHRDDITVFKSVGSGLADLAVADLLWRLKGESYREPVTTSAQAGRSMPVKFM